jgi:chemotaxis family two-component system response regulator Rcp1
MSRAAEILLVEDNMWDVRQVREILAGLEIATHLEAYRDPREALAQLHAPKESDDSHRPDLILLDLNLPYMHGSEVLRIIKADDALRSIPVLILTTSENEHDREDAVSHERTFFATKPFLRSGTPELASLIEKLCREGLATSP